MRTIWILCCFLCVQAYGQQNASSKKIYHLFKPTPKNLMRGLETDRPDITESAYSVDAGHFQIETDVFKTIRNGTNSNHIRQNFYNLANLKIGINNRSDLQLVVENYVTEKNIAENQLSRSRGFGQLTLRYKYNLWGNDEGKSALAVMPYLSFPTGKFVGHNSLEGGIIFPFALSLNDVWGMGAQAQVDFIKTDSGYDQQLLNSITFARDLNDKWNAFIESYFTYQLKAELFTLSINGGISYSISDNLKLDAGFNYGLTKNTDKVYFTGFSFRY